MNKGCKDLAMGSVTIAELSVDVVEPAPRLVRLEEGVSNRIGRRITCKEETWKCGSTIKNVRSKMRAKFHLGDAKCELTDSTGYVLAENEDVTVADSDTAQMTVVLAEDITPITIHAYKLTGTSSDHLGQCTASFSRFATIPSLQRATLRLFKIDTPMKAVLHSPTGSTLDNNTTLGDNLTASRPAVFHLAVGDVHVIKCTDCNNVTAVATPVVLTHLSRAITSSNRVVVNTSLTTWPPVENLVGRKKAVVRVVPQNGLHFVAIHFRRHVLRLQLPGAITVDALRRHTADNFNIIQQSCRLLTLASTGQLLPLADHLQLRHVARQPSSEITQLVLQSLSVSSQRNVIDCVRSLTGELEQTQQQCSLTADSELVETAQLHEEVRLTAFIF